MVVDVDCVVCVDGAAVRVGEGGVLALAVDDPPFGEGVLFVRQVAALVQLCQGGKRLREALVVAELQHRVLRRRAAAYRAPLSSTALQRHGAVERLPLGNFSGADHADDAARCGHVFVAEHTFAFGDDHTPAVCRCAVEVDGNTAG